MALFEIRNGSVPQNKSGNPGPRIKLGGAPLVTEVAEEIDWLDLKKASGADGLTAESFKAAKDVLIHCLAADFSQF